MTDLGSLVDELSDSATSPDRLDDVLEMVRTHSGALLPTQAYYAAARNENCSPTTLSRILELTAGWPKNPRTTIQFLLSDNASSPRELLDRLCEPGILMGATVRCHIAARSNIPLDLLLQLATSDTDGGVREFAARNPLLSGVELENLSRSRSTSTRAGAGGNTNCTPDMLERLAKDKDPAVRLAVSGNINAPDSVLDLLARDDVWSIRVNVARNANTAELTLAALSEDPDIRVRTEVARNLNTGAEILSILNQGPGATP